MLADFPYRARFVLTSGRQMNNRNIGRLENFKRNALFVVTPLCYCSFKFDSIAGIFHLRRQQIPHLEPLYRKDLKPSVKVRNLGGSRRHGSLRSYFREGCIKISFKWAGFKLWKHLDTSMIKHLIRLTDSGRKFPSSSRSSYEAVASQKTKRSALSCNFSNLTRFFLPQNIHATGQ